MNNYLHKRNLRSRELTRTGRRRLVPLVVGSLIVIAVMSLLPCREETRAADTREPIAVKDALQRILGVKDAAVERADQLYAQWVAAADKSYEQSLSKARTFWTRKIDDAKSTAVTDLKALGTRLAAGGQLGETVNVLKAVYAIKPRDGDTVKALTSAGVDLTTIQPEPDYIARRNGGQASRIVIWNTHNSKYNTSGSLQFNVVLFRAGKPVWRADKVDLPWERNTDTFAVVNIPVRQFDVVRVEITKWRGYSGGLAEIEIWQGGKNIALRMPTRASASADRRTTSTRVTDGITTSNVYKNGYWLLPDKQAGWIEISLARPAYRQLLRAKISARKPWQKIIEVAEGDVIDITAGGKWRASPRIVAGPDGGALAGGDQWGKFRDRFYLQGRLAEDGEVFKVGSRFTLRATKPGQLELGMNEEKADWFENNSGFLDVTLSVRKRSSAPQSGSAAKSVASGERRQINIQQPTRNVRFPSNTND
jgi:hypothetical protein